MVEAELLTLLACPRCKGPLEVQDEHALRCPTCALCYPMRDGLPILLLDEALADVDYDDRP